MPHVSIRHLYDYYPHPEDEESKALVPETSNTLPKASNLYVQTPNLEPQPAVALNLTLSPEAVD